MLYSLLHSLVLQLIPLLNKLIFTRVENVLVLLISALLMKYSIIRFILKPFRIIHY